MNGKYFACIYVDLNYYADPIWKIFLFVSLFSLSFSLSRKLWIPLFYPITIILVACFQIISSFISAAKGFYFRLIGWLVGWWRTTATISTELCGVMARNSFFLSLVSSRQSINFGTKRSNSIQISWYSFSQFSLLHLINFLCYQWMYIYITRCLLFCFIEYAFFRFTLLVLCLNSLRSEIRKKQLN